MLSLAGEDHRADIDLGASARARRARGTVPRRRAEGHPARPDAPGADRDRRTTTAFGFPPALALTGKALAQMQLATAELDPYPRPVRGRRRPTSSGASAGGSATAPIRSASSTRGEAQVRLTRLAEAFERLAGTRPGQRLQVQFSGIERLEDDHPHGRAPGRARDRGRGVHHQHRLHRRLDSGRDAWVPITLGVVGAILTVGLLVDLFLRRTEAPLRCTKGRMRRPTRPRSCGRASAGGASRRGPCAAAARATRSRARSDAEHHALEPSGARGRAAAAPLRQTAARAAPATARTRSSSKPFSTASIGSVSTSPSASFAPPRGRPAPSPTRRHHARPRARRCGPRR